MSWRKVVQIDVGVMLDGGSLCKKFQQQLISSCQFFENHSGLKFYFDSNLGFFARNTYNIIQIFIIIFHHFFVPIAVAHVVATAVMRMIVPSLCLNGNSTRNGVQGGGCCCGSVGGYGLIRVSWN